MNRYIAYPKSTPKSGILVLHAWWGLNEFIKSLCDRLASEGYIAFAPDLYHGKSADRIEDAEKLRKTLKGDVVKQDILSALEQLRSEPAIQGLKTGLIGFSLGAYWSLWLVEEKPDDLLATVIFYGARGGEYQATSSAFLGHFAENDPYVAKSGRKKLEKMLISSGKDVSFNTYPGTHHWFFESDRPEYDPMAAKLAWQRTLEFFNKHLI